MEITKNIKQSLSICALALLLTGVASAQDQLPRDNGLATYHTAPRYRESESHPLRVLAYVLHPIGWVAREAFFRPLSYFASSSETTASVMGYRDPTDFREPECFSSDASVPDCRSIAPFNYDTAIDVMEAEPVSLNSATERQVYIPDVNFEFDKSQLNDLGEGKARQIAQLLEQNPGVQVVLEGHADYRGSAEYNDKLGSARAEAVKSQLVSLGVPADKISTVTFGKSKPIFTDETASATAVNRRVEVRLDTAAAQ